MTASELQELASAMNWHTSQTFTPSHKETFTQAAEVLELVAWAEESKVIIDRGDDLWSAWWEGGPQVYGKTLIGTLRRAREASK